MVFEYAFQTADIAIFLTLILLEGVLSFDNAAVLAAMVRKLPVAMRRKALLYGLAGAYVFRTLAIVSVAFIIRYPILKVLGGAYLIYLAVKHLFFAHRQDGTEHHPFAFLARIGVSGFWGTVLAIELADIAFALDQVLVAVAMTEKIPLIIGASLVAILFLRLSAVYITRIMDWFPGLEKLAYVAVGFVGLKLVAVEAMHAAGYTEFEISKFVSVGVTFSLLVLPPVIKFAIEWLRRGERPKGERPPSP
jgi:YkoY family integral membrane protein